MPRKSKKKLKKEVEEGIQKRLDDWVKFKKKKR